ncbi:MAG: hypothetical protein GY867_12025 [bacterium]|nr:hypothetical protein [bacterium]
MGLGQIYNGQIAKGVAFIVVYTISWLLVFALIGLLTTPILFIFGMYDAYRSAEKVNYDIARRNAYASNYTTDGPAPV